MTVAHPATEVQSPHPTGADGYRDAAQHRPHIPLARAATGESLGISPSYKYVFWEHTHDNVPAAAEEVTDCDVLALEVTGGTAEQRKTWQEKFNKLLSTDTPDAERQDLLEALYAEGASSALWAHLLGSLPKRNQQVVLIDINTSSDMEAFTSRQWQYDGEALRRAHERYAPNAALRYHAAQELRAGAAAIAARDKVVSAQLRELGELPEMRGARIGVLIGAAHAGIYNTAPERSPKSLAFVGLGGAGPQHEAIFHRHHSLMLGLRFDPSREIPQTGLDRVVIAQTAAMLGYYGAERAVGDGRNSELRWQRAVDREFVDHLTDTEVADLMARLDEAKFVNERGAVMARPEDFPTIKKRVRLVLDTAIERVQQRRLAAAVK